MNVNLPFRRPPAARTQQPAAWETALSIGGGVICVAIIALILWNAASERDGQPRLDYRQCGTITEEASRLACYDEAFRQASRPAKTFGEILSRQ